MRKEDYLTEVHYVSEDGKHFISEEICLKYEELVKKFYTTDKHIVLSDGTNETVAFRLDSPSEIDELLSMINTGSNYKLSCISNSYPMWVFLNNNDGEYIDDINYYVDIFSSIMQDVNSTYNKLVHFGIIPVKAKEK